MNRITPDLDGGMPDDSFSQQFSQQMSQRISRRRLFEFGGATVGFAAILAACSKKTAPAPGRVGSAPVPTDLPDLEINDAVYLRTMQSLEHSIIDVYGTLAGLAGLGEGTTAALARFTEDHTATAEALGQLATDNGGEPFACANPWLMERAFLPALDYIVGKPGEVAPTPASTTGDDEASDTTEVDDGSIEPTDDTDRDTLAMINGLETLATSTYQLMVEKLTTPALRTSVIPFGAQAARRSATIAIQAGGDEERFVSPLLVGEELLPEDGFTPAYAISTRFGRLTPIDVLIGAKNDLDLRYTATFETPANNAYAYAEMSCPA